MFFGWEFDFHSHTSAKRNGMEWVSGWNLVLKKRRGFRNQRNQPKGGYWIINEPKRGFKFFFFFFLSCIEFSSYC